MTGTTGVAPGTAVGPGTSNTGIVSGRTAPPEIYITEATTSIGGGGTTQAGLPGGTTRLSPGASSGSQSSKPGTSVAPGSPATGSATGATRGHSGTTIRPGSSRTEATTFTGGSGAPGTGPRPETTVAPQGPATGSMTGTTGVAPGTAVGPGTSNTGIVSGRTAPPEIYITEATTSIGGGGTTQAGLPGGTSVAPGSPATGSATGATRGHSGTTIRPGSSRTEATTFTGGSGAPGTGPRPGEKGSLPCGVCR
ncbi:apomucin-like isoform X2 [Pteronotus mesoamericanus]|uniref:apomucin-like isoform X2 n=1 Tax=Pteronotus mesoamericanus TaxID=1884717 RepID=UPI0023EB02D3|nr:apomucin-like isoform X2 [Pteronotus parnellii mesoamericanus]